MAAQLNRYLGYNFSYLMEPKYSKNDFSYNSKFCNSIEKDQTFYKYNKINSILLVEKFNKNTSRYIIVMIES